MTRRLLISVGALALLTLALGRVAAQAPGKTWTPSLTPDGQPDLQGNWVSNTATPLERPKALEGRQILTDEEVAELKERADRIFNNGDSDFAAGDGVFLAALDNVQQFHSVTATSNSDSMIERVFDNRTSQIIDPPDGKVPSLTPEALKRPSVVNATLAAGLRPVAGPEDLSGALRCITYGVPRLGGLYGAGHYSYYQILQVPGFVVLLMEAIHDARIIPLDGRPHLPQNVRTWNGDSIGRWEGKTLVVDTTNFSPKSNFMGSAENLHLVERFTRVGPDEINYEVTLDDPSTWVRPWTAAYPLRQTKQALYEYACHEGNYATMTDMLRAARKEDNAAEEAAQKKEVPK